jgi:primosomal protein N' (replication factor Y)
MKLISVIPISRGTPLEALTYISPVEIPKGTLIHVPVRSTSTPAVVEDCKDADKEKAQIKSLGYAIKVLKDTTGSTLFLPAFMDAIGHLAKWYAGTPGSILASIVPLSILRTKPEVTMGIVPEKSIAGEKFVLQTDTDERIALYKSIIREEFARKRSVLFILPSMQDIDLWSTRIGRGIGDYTHEIHSGLPPKKFVTAWKDVLSTDHPVLILGTPQALAIPRADIGTIIVERESASGYKAAFRPYLDYRKAAEAIAESLKARLILGDQFLRMETLWREEHGELQPLVKPKFRVITSAKSDLVDLSKKEQPATGDATMYSPELLSLIRTVAEKGGHMVILGARKGYAPQTVCGDCGTAVLCVHCSSPVVLYTHGKGANTDKENVFLCHKCGEKRSAGERCRECDSWRLMPLGIGLDRAEEIITKVSPNLRVFRLDRDHVDTHKDAKKVIEDFYRTGNAILLGTEMLLPYLDAPVEYGAILSLQSLLTIPDITMEEKAFRLITTLRAKVSVRFILQTRDVTLPWYEWALQGNLLEWYRHESASRQAFNYPPFSTIVKFTAKGTKEQVAKTISEVKELLAPFSPVVFPGFVGKIRQEYRTHAMVSVPKGKWPDPELLGVLASLPSRVAIQVEPESLI